MILAPEIARYCLGVFEGMATYIAIECNIDLEDGGKVKYVKASGRIYIHSGAETNNVRRYEKYGSIEDFATAYDLR